MKQLFLVRGLPGCGKSTFVRHEWEGSTSGPVAEHLEADKFFTFNKEGEYKFNKEMLPTAHAWCLGETYRSLSNNKVTVVSNTFSQLWELEPYIEAANSHGVALNIIDLYDNGWNDEDLCEKCVHNVPLAVICKMRNRWELFSLNSTVLHWGGYMRPHYTLAVKE
jgi:predicted kinase